MTLTASGTTGAVGPSALPKVKDELLVTGTVTLAGEGYELKVEEVRRGAEKLYPTAK